MKLKKKIIVGITGSVAASKSAHLISKLKKDGADLRVILTKSALQFVDYNELKKLVGDCSIYQAQDLFGDDEMLHIELAKFAELILIAPASANFIAKLSGGFADDLISAVCLASNSQVAVVPAMNQQMWANRFTQDNIASLIRNDIEVLGPAYGQQACGDIGFGRMIEPEEIVNMVYDLSISSLIFAGKKILISAGPTIEQIDAVRYISNFSSGKMGWELAKAAKKMGAAVTIVSGPVHLALLSGVKIEFVQSAEQMLEGIMKHAAESDIFISAAAVADYKAATILRSKLKKKDEKLNIELVPNKDILKEIAKIENPPFTVGFAAETDDLIANAKKKLVEKKLDMIIINDVSDGAVFGSDYNRVYILSKESNEPVFIDQALKSEVARAILEQVAENYTK